MAEKSINLVICSPILHMDSYAALLAQSLAKLKSAGLEFTHLVVGPERNRSEVATVFRETGSLFLAERQGTKGVFDAVAQGYDHALDTLNPTHLAYINSDDLLEVGFAGAVGHCVAGKPQLITGHVNWIGDKGEYFGRIPTWPHRGLLVRLFEAGVPPFTQQGTILSSDVWRETGGFDLGYKLIADTVFWHHLLKNKMVSRVFVPLVVASYRIRSGQLSADRSAVRAEHAAWRKSLGDTPKDRLGRRLAVGLMRLQNSPKYLRRIVGGKKLRAEGATQAGGF